MKFINNKSRTANEKENQKMLNTCFANCSKYLENYS